MIQGICAIQDRGKTITGVAMATSYQKAGYAVFSTVALPLIPHTHLSIDQMKHHLTSMVDPNKRHICYFVDEINRVFPGREWIKNTPSLTGLWQDEKLDVQLIYTAHTKKDPWRMAREGMNVGDLLPNLTGIDGLIREATRRIIFPFYRPQYDVVELLIHDYRYDQTYTSALLHASSWFSSYNRWAVVS